MSKPLLALVGCLSAFGYAAPAASNTFYEVLPRWSEPNVSADGSAVVASVAIPDFVGTVYRWTLTGSGLTTETLPFQWAQVHGTNRDGSVVVGTDYRANVGGAFRWTAVGGKQILGAPGSIARDVSSDGDIIVGTSDGEGFYWTEALGILPLGFLRGDTSSNAMAVAGDGGPVVGMSIGPPETPPGPRAALEPPLLRAFRWTPARGMHGLGTLPDRMGPGRARGISSDGNVIVGQFDFEAFRWTADHGMVGLGRFPSSHAASGATDVSGDGTRVVGWSRGDGLDEIAFLWTPDGGMRSLKMLLTADGRVDLTGVELLTATSISDDGQVIAGAGRRDGLPITWIAELTQLPPTDSYQCYDVTPSRGSERFEGREVALFDEFGETIQVVRKGKRLCAPVALGSAEVSDPDAHLLCYDLAHRRGQRDYPRSEPIEVRVNNRFEYDRHLTVTRPKQLCVPSTVQPADSDAAPGDPSELELDHFLCYAVRAASRDFDSIEVSLADPFQNSERRLKKPTSLCNPVDKNGEGILDPAKYLTCYYVKPRVRRPALQRLNLDVLVNNQFDAAQRFTVKKPRTVCVPSQVEVVNPGPAACSAIEPGEFGGCRAIIGWGIDPVTGQCVGISGCGCDERCEGRIFPDEMTCNQECRSR